MKKGNQKNGLFAKLTGITIGLLRLKTENINDMLDEKLDPLEKALLFGKSQNVYRRLLFIKTLMTTLSYIKYKDFLDKIYPILVKLGKDEMRIKIELCGRIGDLCAYLIQNTNINQGRIDILLYLFPLIDNLLKDSKNKDILRYSMRAFLILFTHLNYKNSKMELLSFIICLMINNEYRNIGIVLLLKICHIYNLEELRSLLIEHVKKYVENEKDDINLKIVISVYLFSICSLYNETSFQKIYPILKTLCEDSNITVRVINMNNIIRISHLYSSRTFRRFLIPLFNIFLQDSHETIFDYSRLNLLSFLFLLKKPSMIHPFYMRKLIFFFDYLFFSHSFLLKYLYQCTKIRREMFGKKKKDKVIETHPGIPVNSVDEVPLADEVETPSSDLLYSSDYSSEGSVSESMTLENSKPQLSFIQSSDLFSFNKLDMYNENNLTVEKLENRKKQYALILSIIEMNIYMNIGINKLVQESNQIKKEYVNKEEEIVRDLDLNEANKRMPFEDILNNTEYEKETDSKQIHKTDSITSVANQQTPMLSEEICGNVKPLDSIQIEYTADVCIYENRVSKKTEDIENNELSEEVETKEERNEDKEKGEKQKNGYHEDDIDDKKIDEYKRNSSLFFNNAKKSKKKKYTNENAFPFINTCFINELLIKNTHFCLDMESFFTIFYNGREQKEKGKTNMEEEEEKEENEKEYESEKKKEAKEKKKEMIQLDIQESESLEETSNNEDPKDLFIKEVVNNTPIKSKTRKNENENYWSIMNTKEIDFLDKAFNLPCIFNMKKLKKSTFKILSPVKSTNVYIHSFLKNGDKCEIVKDDLYKVESIDPDAIMKKYILENSTDMTSYNLNCMYIIAKHIPSLVYIFKRHFFKLFSHVFFFMCTHPYFIIRICMASSLCDIIKMYSSDFTNQNEMKNNGNKQPEDPLNSIGRLQFNKGTRSRTNGSSDSSKTKKVSKNSQSNYIKEIRKGSSLFYNNDGINDSIENLEESENSERIEEEKEELKSSMDEEMNIGREKEPVNEIKDMRHKCQKKNKRKTKHRIHYINNLFYTNDFFCNENKSEAIMYMHFLDIYEIIYKQYIVRFRQYYDDESSHLFFFHFFIFYFLNDSNILVKQAILEKYDEFMFLFPPSIQKILLAYLFKIGKLKTINYELRFKLSEILQKIVLRINNAKLVQKYIFPLIIKLCNDNVAVVRNFSASYMSLVLKKGCPNLFSCLEKNQLISKEEKEDITDVNPEKAPLEENTVRWIYEMYLIKTIIATFAEGKSYYMRQLFIKICEGILNDCPINFFTLYFLQPFLNLADDKIMLVKITWSKCVHSQYQKKGPLLTLEVIMQKSNMLFENNKDNEIGALLSFHNASNHST